MGAVRIGGGTGREVSSVTGVTSCTSRFDGSAVGAGFTAVGAVSDGFGAGSELDAALGEGAVT